MIIPWPNAAVAAGTVRKSANAVTDTVSREDFIAAHLNQANAAFATESNLICLTFMSLNLFLTRISGFPDLDLSNVIIFFAILFGFCCSMYFYSKMDFFADLEKMRKLAGHPFLPKHLSPIVRVVACVFLIGAILLLFIGLEKLAVANIISRTVPITLQLVTILALFCTLILIGSWHLKRVADIQTDLISGNFESGSVDETGRDLNFLATGPDNSRRN